MPVHPPDDSAQPPPELLGLLDDAVAAPHDPTPRLALADWLEERGDPRAALARLVPTLCATPRRDRPHPDLPCAVWRDPRNGRPRSSLGQWPALTRPLPPGKSRLGRERRGPWRGLHHLGRLLGVALLREVLALPEEAEARAALGPFFARCELYCCGLIDARRRDDAGKVTGPGDLAALANGRLHPLLCRAAWRCRAGPFGGFISLACEAMAYRCRAIQPPSGGSPDEVEHWLRERMRLRAPPYGRIVDLLRAFGRVAPWREAREAWEVRAR